MKVFFVRHGQTDANLDYASYPWNNDCPINEMGAAQATKAAQFLKTEVAGTILVLTSPLLRTRQTAAIVAENLGAEIIIEPRLMEGQVGDWSTRPIKQVYEYFAQLPPAERFAFRPPNGETWLEMGERAASVIENHQADTLVLVSHSATIQCGIGVLANLEFEQWMAHEVTNASVSLLTNESGSWQVEYMAKNVS